MLPRLVLVLMLMLLPLQWALAQAHDAAEEIQALTGAVQASAGASDAAADTVRGEPDAHAREPGGVCQFHDFAHTLALAPDPAGELAAPLLASAAARAGSDARPAAGPPGQIDRPRWPHHGSSVVGL